MMLNKSASFLLRERLRRKSRAAGVFFNKSEKPGIAEKS